MTQHASAHMFNLSCAGRMLTLPAKGTAGSVLTSVLSGCMPCRAFANAGHMLVTQGNPATGRQLTMWQHNWRMLTMHWSECVHEESRKRANRRDWVADSCQLEWAAPCCGGCGGCGAAPAAEVPM